MYMKYAPPNHCKLSVIVPVYNCEDFLENCVRSLQAQTLHEWVAIFVNDGSTDRSGTILEQFASTDERLHVVHKENGGAASARNVGLNIVTTEYVTMMDADDIIHETMFQKMLEAACTSNCDLVVAPSKVQLSNGSYDYQKYTHSGLIKNYHNFLFRNVYRGPVAKLYRNDIIKRHNLRMPEDMPMAEDYVFVVSYWSRVKSVYAISECLYQYEYADNPNSLIHRFCRKELPYYTYQKNAEAAWRVYQFLLSVEKNKSELHKWTYELYRDFWRMSINSLRHLDFHSDREALKAHIRILNSDFSQHIPLIRRLLMIHRYPRLSRILIRIKLVLSQLKRRFKQKVDVLH